MVSYTSIPTRRTSTTYRPTREPASAGTSRWRAVVALVTGRPATVDGAAQRAGTPDVSQTVRDRRDARDVREITATAGRAAVRSLPLAPTERVLAVAVDDGGGWVAATTHALYLADDAAGCPASEGATPQGWTRRGWEAVADVTWDGDLNVLTVTTLLPTVPERTVLSVTRGDHLAGVARDRITATRIVDTVVDTDRHGKVRVTGRRTPATGELVWLARPSAAALLVPGYRADLAKALLRLRADLGI